MQSVALVVSPQSLIRIFIILLYVLISLISYRLLWHRLTVTARRLAALMLIAQILVIAVSIEFQAKWGLDGWLWDLDAEWNIPTVVASTQLALVGGVALLTAWFAKPRRSWHGIYLIAVGLVFAYLARDEYALLHESILGWIRLYAALGGAIVVATLLLALRSPRRTWIWHACLLAGLAMSATGGLVIEQLRPQVQGPFCGNIGVLWLDGCLNTYQYEETLEFAGTWLTLVAMLGHWSCLLPSPRPSARRLLYLLPVLWILFLTNDPLVHRQFLVRPDSVLFESDVELLDFTVERGSSAVVLELEASARHGDHDELGYSVHLVDQVGRQSVAKRDAHWCCQQSELGDALLFQQRIEVDITNETPVDRALWIVLTVWRERGGEFLRQNVLSGDLWVLGDTQLVLGELVIPAGSVAPAIAPIAAFDNGFSLESVALPAQAVAGEVISIEFFWRSKASFDQDLTQFLHFVHEASGEWWGYDQLPLGTRLPTRLWYSGMSDSEIWRVPLPADLAPGSYEVFTGLYRISDLERVPASDTDGKLYRDARVPLGIMLVD